MQRFLSIGLAALLSAGLLACSGGDDSDDSTTAGVTESAATTGATTAAVSPTVVTKDGVPTVVPGKLGVPSTAVYTAAAPDFQPLAGAKAVTGKLGAAVFRIEMPDDWNGDLVIYAHGYRGEGTELTVTSPRAALREQLIADGYAWAASSYSENGYTPGVGADDTLALKNEFERQFGPVDHTYLFGDSMGGAVIALSLENFADEYDGALAICPALGGQEEIDYLAGWSLLAEYITGIKVPIGEGTSSVSAATLLRLSSALGSPETPTEKGRQFLSSVRLLTGGPRPFYLEGMAAQYVANFGYLLIDPQRLKPVTRAATNSELEYEIEPGFGLTSEQLNAGVRRLEADPVYRNAVTYPDRYPTTGKISDPLLTLHNTGDLFVPITHEVDYLAKTKAAGTDKYLVQRAIRAAGHCQFSPEEVTTAWDDLVAWVEDGDKPAGEDLSGDLSDAGKAFTNPLRPGDPGTK